MSREELIELYDQGKLAGVLHLPPAEMQPCPIVIYCPGKNGERYEVHRLAVKYARRLTARGIAFLRFDYYGLGLSDGEYHHMTTTTKLSNVLAAYRYVQTLPQILHDQVAFLGFSDGARIALMAANRSDVSRVVLWSPLFNEYAGNMPNRKLPRFNRHPLYPEFLVMPWAGLWVGMGFYQDLKGIDIDRELRTYRGESLIVYGDDDPLIEEEFSHMQVGDYRLYRHSAKNQLVVVPGAGHLFTSLPFEQRLMAESTHWLRKSFNRLAPLEGK
ncbi:alpha/beta hydrolase [Brevibacillus humidisoli]|uniref:alpha/beta hydrolase n=1 Tax=Brevibacillus humidisoli TaxID=2895522 RepID=UPI001E2F7F7D|nr:alpha/beta hydrolase family protein [Brevibacillus humidisoli]UFJ42411.1 alpha/beta hydrolase [Brevibacillus humidisoli]